jgi:hypothetical protein
MDTLVNHVETYLGLYMLLVIVLLAAATILAIDLLSPRRQRGARDHRDIPDHTRAVHMNHPWAGMDESGPDIP